MSTSISADIGNLPYFTSFYFYNEEFEYVCFVSVSQRAHVIPRVHKIK